jgi:pimeloyl-ACP methyl ester carboxylesterase
LRLLSLAFLPVMILGCAPVRPMGPSTDPKPTPRPITAYDAELSNYPYPFPVSFHTFTAQGQPLRMAYLDVAPTSDANGRTVLLLHGKNFSAAYWGPTIRALIDRGYRVVAPDQVGFGKSSKPEHYQFSFHALAENTRSLLDALGIDRVSVVGHSMGGMLATRFALLYPDRTDRLVLVNPIGLEDYRIIPYRTVDEHYRHELKSTPESIRAYQQKNYYAGRWKPEYEKLMEILAGWTRHPDYPRIAWNSALTTDMILTQPVVHEFPRLTVPTLLVIGQRDRTAVGAAWAPQDVARTMGDYPSLGKKVAAAIPNAKLVEIPNAGHLPQVEAFDTYINALTDYLKPQ